MGVGVSGTLLLKGAQSLASHCHPASFHLQRRRRRRKRTVWTQWPSRWRRMRRKRPRRRKERNEAGILEETSRAGRPGSSCQVRTMHLKTWSSYMGCDLMGKLRSWPHSHDPTGAGTRLHRCWDSHPGVHSFFPIHMGVFDGPLSCGCRAASHCSLYLDWPLFHPFCQG